MYYAHIREDGAKQPVAAHLDGTAERAAEFAAAFNVKCHPISER